MANLHPQIDPSTSGIDLPIVSSNPPSPFGKGSCSKLHPKEKFSSVLTLFFFPYSIFSPFFCFFLLPLFSDRPKEEKKGGKIGRRESPSFYRRRINR
jgi:hypothetical protein